MKKHFILAAMAMTALFTACNNEDDDLKNENEGKKVTFVIGGVDSRATTTGSLGAYTTVFQTDDAVGIYASGGATASNSKYTVTESESVQTLDGQPISYTEGEETTFTAYYPYAGEGSKTTESEGVVTMTVGDQIDGIDEYDLMTAKETISTESAVTFDFAHQLAMVEVQVVGTIGANVTSMNLNNIKPTVTWTATSNTTSDASGNATDIKMYQIDATNNVYVALVPAQTIAKGTRIFTTLINNKGYTFTTSSNVSLDANNIKRYKITIDEQVEEPTIVEVTGLGLNVLNWSATEETPDGTLSSNECDDNSDAIISEYDFINARLTSEIFSGYKAVTQGKWGKIENNVNDDTNVTLSNGSLIVKNNKEASAWYNTGLAYHTEKITTPGIYRLTFYLKSPKENDVYTGDGLTIPVYIVNGETVTENTSLKKYPVARDAQWILDYDLSALTGSESIIIGFGIKTPSDLTQYTITNLTLTKRP